MTAKPSTTPGLLRFQLSSLFKLGAGAAANRRVVEADVAAATAFAAGVKAIAARLNHCTASLVAARAADAAAVFRVFALANAGRQINLAARNAVHRAAATAQSVGQHAAKVLQRAAGDFVIATAMDLAAARCFLEFDRATRKHTPIRTRRRAGRNRTRLETLDRARERRDSR